MKLIDAEALIKKAYDEAKGMAEPYDDFGVLVEWLVSKSLTIESEQKWVLVSKRLPKTNGIYNVTRRVSDGFCSFNITDTCYFDGSNTWHDDTRVNHERKYLTDVVAWCELPEPYKEEGEK